VTVRLLPFTATNAMLFNGTLQTMRDALDEAMTRVPTEYATVETKAYLATFSLPKVARRIENWSPQPATRPPAELRRSAFADANWPAP
jgi:hypothetical protein